MTLKELKKFIKSIPKEYDDCDIKMFLDEELGYEMDLDNLVVVQKHKLDPAYNYPRSLYDREKDEFIFTDEKELLFIRDFEVEEYRIYNMTEPLLCRTADGKIHWTSQSAAGGLIDSREYETYCGQQVVSVVHEPITANDWYHNLTDEEKQHMKNVDKIMEDWGGELCPRCQRIREQEERQAWGLL